MEEERKTKSNKYRMDAYVVCPYYLRESFNEVRCLGCVGQFTTSTFQTKRLKNEHKDDFCKTLYKACPIFQLIEEKEIINDEKAGGESPGFKR